ALRATTAGKEPARDLGEAKAGLWCTNPHVAKEGEFESGSQTVPIDCRQQGFGDGERREAPGAARFDDGCGRGVGSPAALGALFETGAGAEGPAGAGNDSNPDIGVLADSLQHCHERTAEFAIHGSADCSAVEGDDGYVVSQIKKQRVTVHDRAPLSQ